MSEIRFALDAVETDEADETEDADCAIPCPSARTTNQQTMIAVKTLKITGLKCRSLQANWIKQVIDTSSAVSKVLKWYANAIEQRQVKVGQGVSSLNRTCLPPRCLPAAPPATRIGKSLWSCRSGSPIPLP